MNQDAVKLAIVAAGALAAWYFLIRPARAVAAAVGTAYAPGGVAYEAGNAVQDALVPGVDSLGTWLYGLFNSEPDYTAAVQVQPKPASYDYGFGAGTGPLRPGFTPAPQPPADDPFYTYWGT